MSRSTTTNSPPGDLLGYCYHRHREQEEVFAVIEGAATFDTEGGDVEVTAGELVWFAPGEWQQGSNRGTERTVILAIGAPREHGLTDLRRDCPACGRRTEAVPEHDGDILAFHCGNCGGVTGEYDLDANRD